MDFGLKSHKTAVFVYFCDMVQFYWSTNLLQAEKLRMKLKIGRICIVLEKHCALNVGFGQIPCKNWHFGLVYCFFH